jgi:hypothetical protein
MAPRRAKVVDARVDFQRGIFFMRVPESSILEELLAHSEVDRKRGSRRSERERHPEAMRFPHADFSPGIPFGLNVILSELAAGAVIAS